VEAFDSYWRQLNPKNGLIAIHISTNHIDLMPVMQGLVAHYHAASAMRFDVEVDPYWTSCWVVIARNTNELSYFGEMLQPLPSPSEKLPARLWTDNYSDIVRLLR
jgi:hypothetical protein